MKIKFISGCSAGKPNLITIVKDNGKAIVLDCGFQYEMPDFGKIEEEVEEIFITHAHADHIGGLTMLKRQFPEAKIYMSEPTMEIGKITIGSLEIKNKYKIPMKEIEEVMSEVELIKEGSLLKFEDYKVLPLYAGHVLGALSYLIKIDSTNILYTGDISLTDLPLAGKFDHQGNNIDLIISESNFSIGLDNFKDVIEKIAQQVSATIKIKGRIIMPMPAAGRAQEIAAYLAYKMISNEMPHATIYLDGSIKDVAKIYDKYADFLRGSLRETYLKARSSGLLKLVTDDIRKELIRSERPLIVLATSANLMRGPSMIYVEESFLDENATILFTGRIDEKTIAKRILNSKKGELIEFHGVALSRKCNVAMLEVNEHGNASGLLSLIDKASIKGVILTHGNDLVKHYISQYLLKENSRYAIIEPLEGDIINLTLLMNLLNKNKFVEDEEFFEAILERLIAGIRQEYDAGNAINIEKLEDLLNKNDILVEARNIERAKSLFFVAFRYAVKYSYKNQRVYFDFSAEVLDKLSQIISQVLGKSAVEKLFAQLSDTAPKFFKNLVLKGGTMKANLGIEISSLIALKETIEDFERNFKRFSVRAPSIEEVKKLCEQEIAIDKSLKVVYDRVFSA